MNNLEFLKKFEAINRKYYLTNYPSPVQKLSFASGQRFFIKHDDELDLSCSKQRSIPWMIDSYLAQGFSKFAISSTGNAALVASHIALNAPEIQELKVFFSNSISVAKVQHFIATLRLDLKIEDFHSGLIYKNIEFILNDNPKQHAFQLAKEGYINLRGSTDDSALVGFKSIAYELQDQIDNIDAVFICASSGTTALGIYEGFKEISDARPAQQGAHITPAMHIVQTTKVFALLKRIVKDEFSIENDHPSESILDIIGHRRVQIENMIYKTGGNGYIINKNDAIKAKEELRELFNVEASYDSILSYAAFKKALELKKFENPVLVFTGA